jgi:hypothetical protein
MQPVTRLRLPCAGAALHMAAANGHVDIVRLLLGAHAVRALLSTRSPPAAQVPCKGTYHCSGPADACRMCHCLQHLLALCTPEAADSPPPLPAPLPLAEPGCAQQARQHAPPLGVPKRPRGGRAPAGGSGRKPHRAKQVRRTPWRGEHAHQGGHACANTCADA